MSREMPRPDSVKVWVSSTVDGRSPDPYHQILLAMSELQRRLGESLNESSNFAPIWTTFKCFVDPTGWGDYKVIVEVEGVELGGAA